MKGCESLEMIFSSKAKENWSLKVFTTEASEVTKKDQILALVNQANESSSCYDLVLAGYWETPDYW